VRVATLPTPTFRRMPSIRHHFVKPDRNRFAPTNAVEPIPVVIHPGTQRQRCQHKCSCDDADVAFSRIKARNEDRAVQRREPKRPTAPERLRRTKFRLERFCRWFCDPALNWIEASRVSYSTIAQDVPLPNGATIRRGSQIEKRIFEVTPAGGGSGAKVSMPFERLNVKGKCIPVVTNLRAIAGFMEK
jgi:hypothetical protein